MQALLVVDVDRENNWPSNIADLSLSKKPVGEAILLEIQTWRQRDDPIIFVVYAYDAPEAMQTCFDGVSKNCIVCKESRYQLARFLDHQHIPGSLEAVCIKRSYDAFFNKELAPYLRSRGITEVVLMGCETDICIQYTAVGALKHGFRVTLLEQCTYPQFENGSRSGEVGRWIKSVMRYANAKPPLSVTVR